MEWQAEARGTNREVVLAARLRSSSTKDKTADVIRGHQRPLRAVVFGWHRSLFLQAKMPKRRIFDLTAALHADGDPSGEVHGVDDGGRVCRSCSSSGGEEGPDYFFLFLDRVFLVKVEALFIVSVSLRVLFVSYPAA